MRSASESNRSVLSGRFYTIPQASRELGIPSYKLRRAVKLGVIRSYGVLDGRRYVRIEDIREVMADQGATTSEQASFEFPEVASSKGGSL